MADPAHVRLRGAVEGDYLVTEQGSGDELRLVPEWPSENTSAEAILKRAGGSRTTREELDCHLGHLPSDGEGSAPEPAFGVHIDGDALSEDLAHATQPARAAIESTVGQLRANGVPADPLQGGDTEARDGTRLPECVKLHVPQPGGQRGAVFLGGELAGKPTLLLLAVDERHPTHPWRPSDYQPAHRPLNG